MDDVTSGFNIGTNISLRPGFNEILGFTEEEVRSTLHMYRDRGAITQDPDTILDLMREWYDGYRFAAEATNDIYNTDLVLYYLRESITNGAAPKQLIDSNVRMDYSKLRHLLLVNRQVNTSVFVPNGKAELNGNFNLLGQVIAEERADVDIRDSFPLERLVDRDNFLSLLYYFGLLSVRGSVEGTTRLGVPNQTVRQLLYGRLRGAFEDMGAFAADFHALERRIHEMAYRGAWRPVFDYLADAVARQSGIRDYIAGEKVLQGFLAAYLGASEHFVFHSERELGGGHADVCLAAISLNSNTSDVANATPERWTLRPGRRWHSYAATWPTIPSIGSIRRYGSPGWHWHSMAGSWSAVRPFRRGRDRPPA